MAAAWELDIPSAEKMVLLCLCDFAGDHGSCWPSVKTIARKCSKSERTVQGAIKWLRDQGYCDWNETPGKPHMFTLNPRKICTPAETAPPQKLQVTPAESADEPLRTIKRKKEARELPDDWLPAEFGEGTQSRKVVDGWPPGELERQLEKFHAHQRKTGNMFKDWQAAWSTWVLNSVDFGAGHGQRQSTPDDGLSATTRAGLSVFGAGDESRLSG